MNSLPLSWSMSDEPNNQLNEIKSGNFEWLPFLNVSYQFSLSNFLRQKCKSKRKYIIRGCKLEHKNKLEQHGFHFSKVGLEAVLRTDVNHFNKKSLVSLIKRGKKHGEVINIEYSEISRRKLKEFRNETVHAKFPQLRFLFRSEFKKDNLLFAFVDSNRNWLGAMLLSKNSQHKLHTELLLRRKNAPVGIMETLVEYSFLEAKMMGYKEISLGEVPFINPILDPPDWISILTASLGRMLRFAYNYRGLYDFKNKFRPEWEPVFICSNNKIGIRLFIVIFFQSKFHKLVASKGLFFLKNYLKEKYSIIVGNFILRKLDFIKT